MENNLFESLEELRKRILRLEGIIEEPQEITKEEIDEVCSELD